MKPIKEVGTYMERLSPMICITSACDNPEGVFTYFVDKILDGGDVQMLWQYGVEGVHYQWNDDGATIDGLATQATAWLGAEGETWRHSKTYLQLVILDMPFLFTINMYTAINQAQGDTFRPMLLNFLGILLNMGLDPLLMVALHMGAAGAALATVTAKAVPAVVAFVLLQDRRKDIYLSLKGLKFEKSKLKSILTVGMPTAIGGSTMQFGFLLMSRNVFAYGTQAMAAYGIGNKINSLITLPTNGIGSAVATIVGQNVGANQYERAEQGYRLSRNISVVFLFAGGMILSRMPVSTAIVRIFSDDAEVIFGLLHSLLY